MNIARIKRVVFSAVMGFFVFGAWAYAVNFHYPERRLISALSQGVFSFGFSLVVMSITEGTFAWLAGKRWQIPLSIAVPVATSIGCATLIHLAAHTPSIALTLLGPGLVGTAYQIGYVMHLRRQSRPGPSSETHFTTRA